MEKEKCKLLDEEETMLKEINVSEGTKKWIREIIENTPKGKRELLLKLIEADK